MTKSTGATAVGGGFFSTNTRDTLAEGMQCSGAEGTLRQCSYSAGYDEQCTHDAAVICQGTSLALYKYQ